MTQVSLLDSKKLSDLLQQALAWRDAVSSLMVSATNGAVLAYAFRDGTPTMKEIRSLSTTTTTAYTVASEDVLVFEAQLSRALSVLAPIADHILLAVQGPDRRRKPREDGITNASAINGSNAQGDGEQEQVAERADTMDNGQEQDSTREDLEYVSEELSAILRAELRGMRWPEDI
ncbi:uncharacterized protein HMPREF1541_05584 [Cyphellophora europaea CBS 101466]|uniref:Roadblock/LAMTOR2 domain-containing protein n=1 Tax=Cyphellophora europaea (strain CBS 101466) TaxID=1220924 RepID=W2RS84_CYPE1|nr:uncharacterized protein HMPREF1541_05584 [Cyphellophora europaea CBS 101466]ETN39361.1 hypothetical protein HMPREF1541_05584 [Cyphellophora europaea CBS 101466]